MNIAISYIHHHETVLIYSILRNSSGAQWSAHRASCLRLFGGCQEGLATTRERAVRVDTWCTFASTTTTYVLCERVVEQLSSYKTQSISVCLSATCSNFV